MACLYKWLVALLPFFKIGNSVCGFSWVCTLDPLCLKKMVKGGRTKGRTIGDISKSVRGQFQNSQSQYVCKQKWSHLY